MHSIRASARYNRAIHATAELLGKLRIESMFVGNVARAAWLGGGIESGAVNRGYRVDREELEQTEELDLVPLNFIDAEGDVRVHVLLATNALYGRMVPAGVPALIDEREIRVPRAEDLALLLLFAEDEATVRALAVLPEFDRAAFQQRLVSIGLGEWAGIA